MDSTNADARHTKRRRLGAAAGLVSGGALVGAVLAASLSANAATPTTPSPGATTAAPGVQEKNGIPEGQEHHGRGGHDLGLTGTVTAVGSGSLTVQPSTGAAVTYQVDSGSDIDKNGEAQLSALVAGDAVRYSVRSGTTTIDKLHAGDETKNRPSGTPGMPSGSGA